MNRIGFQNFRRFEYLPALRYSNITFLVGRNNAGKSTLVKALLLIDNYFKSPDFKQLSFGNNVLEDANIVTYGRAKNAKSEINQIEFEFQFGDFYVFLLLTGNDEKSFADIVSLTIIGEFIFNFDMINKSLKIEKEYATTVNSTYDVLLADLNSLMTDIEKQIANPALKKTSKEYIELVTELDKLQGKINDLNTANNKKNNKIIYQIEGDFGIANSLSEIVSNLITNSKREYSTIFNNIQNGEEAPENFEALKAFNDYGMTNISDGIFDPFIDALQTSSTVYLSANLTKQSALFSIRDKNNALAQAIHDYQQLNILEGEEEHRFILEWMKAFDVGDNFNIQMFSGEAYEMKINSSSGDVHLADKGMGSIQVMALIMKLACAIRRRALLDIRPGTLEGYKEYPAQTTIIIEEPELSLHPALQSKLADLFLDVYKRYGINFIVETHSEYLIRKTQLLVKDNDFEVAPNENPFSVIYFDDIKGPYRMKYREDGKFIEDFGKGFYDESALLTLNLL